jgi:hypothetical protein
VDLYLWPTDQKTINGMVLFCVVTNKNFKIFASTGKVTVSVFWDSLKEGIDALLQRLKI